MVKMRVYIKNEKKKHRKTTLFVWGGFPHVFRMVLSGPGGVPDHFISKKISDKLVSWSQEPPGLAWTGPGRKQIEKTFDFFFSNSRPGQPGLGNFRVTGPIKP